MNEDVDLHLTEEEQRGILSDGVRHVIRIAPAGRTWDTFRVDGKRFELIDVSERPLDTVASRYYRVEGCGTPEEFIGRWKAGHPGSKDPRQPLYIHWFRDVTSGPADG